MTTFGTIKLILVTRITNIDYDHGVIEWRDTISIEGEYVKVVLLIQCWF